MSDQDAIRKKIAALRAKARGRGATEAEAMAAAEMAAALMREAGLSDDDIEFDERRAPMKTRGGGARDALWGTVATCTNTSPMIMSYWDETEIIYVGCAPGPEIAIYLVAVLNRAVDREVAAFKESATYRRRRKVASRRQAVQDFTQGLVARLRQRLRELFAETTSDTAAAEARRVRDQRYPDSRPVAASYKPPKFASAVNAGFTAGDRVQLAHGVAGTGAPRQIGKLS